VENIPFGMLTVTNNAGGRQPISMANIREVSRPTIPWHPSTLCSTVAENAYSSSCAKKAVKTNPPKKLPRDVLTADSATMSAKKDTINIGGSSQQMMT
jgi:tryptophanase